jgi:hypothetical protein
MVLQRTINKRKPHQYRGKDDIDDEESDKKYVDDYFFFLC